MAASALDAAGNHVLEKLFVPGRVDDDVLPPRGAKRNLRRVDRDVLRLLLEQSIEQKGVFEFHSFRGASLLYGCDLPFGQ